jgi:DNA topoisomerase IB
MRLRRVDPSEPGITRRRCGRGFSYAHPDGSRVSGLARERLLALAVPPAWKDVWICTSENGHIQATGIDEAGRRQYVYHPAWRERRDAQKWDKVLDFARHLPELRARVAEDLRRADLSRECVLALAVRLLDRGLFRVGTEQYDSEGLATLKVSSVQTRGTWLTFDYVAKHGVRQIEKLEDPEAADLVRKLRQGRAANDELLAWKGPEGWVDVTSQDLNAYIKQLAGEAASAKDFRSWHGTVLCATYLAQANAIDAAELPYASPVAGEVSSRDPIVEAIARTAQHLGNTPAVCRSAYVDPRVIERYEAGQTLDLAASAVEGADPTASQQAVEAATIKLIEGRSDQTVRRAAMAAVG